MYAKIFKSIDRLPQLIKYYNKCQKDVLLKNWRNQLEIEQDEPVTKWLHSYYDHFLSNWHLQFKWIQQVFPDEAVTEAVLNVYTNALLDLNPSLNCCIDAALKQTPEKLTLLHELMLTNEHFLRNLKDIIETSNQGMTMHMFYLKSKNIKNHPAGKPVDPDKYLPLKVAVYKPFTIYIGKYAAYEQAQLLQKLSNLKCIKEDLPDTIQALGMSIPVVFDYARDSKKRCLEITYNCGFCGLLIALRALLLSFADQFRVAQRQLDRIKSQDEDWNTFQLCLSLLQHAGDVLLNLQQLEQELMTTALDFNKTDAIKEYKVLLLADSDRKEFNSLIKCISEGTELSLLDHVTSEFSRLCSDVHHTTYKVVFAPISTQLDQVKHTNVHDVSTADLPDYSYSPQEYITQVKFVLRKVVILMLNCNFRLGNICLLCLSIWNRSFLGRIPP